jgi:hypothetical protein
MTITTTSAVRPGATPMLRSLPMTRPPPGRPSSANTLRSSTPTAPEGCPQHAGDRRHDEQRRVAVGSQDELDELLVNIAGQEPRDALGQHLRLGVVAEHEHRQRRDAERERHERRQQEPRQGGNIIGQAGTPVQCGRLAEQAPDRDESMPQRRDLRAVTSR